MFGDVEICWDESVAGEEGADAVALTCSFFGPD